MRFLHTADLHLDAPILALSDSESVRRASLGAFSEIIRYAEQNNIPFVVIAGDLFDTPHPRESTKAAVLKLWESVPDITFFLLGGNHDPIEGGYLGMTLPSNVKLFGKEWTTYTVEGGAFHGRSYGSGGSLMEGLPFAGEGAQIAVLHGDIQTTDADKTVNANLLHQAGMQYAALGHVHKRREPHRAGGCLICNSGCVVGHGFDETGEKGFYDVTVQNGVASAEFVIVDAPRFYEITLEVTPDDTPADILQKTEAAALQYREKDFLRVRYVGESAQSLPTKYNGSANILEMINDTALPQDFAALQNEQTLRGLFVKGMMEKIDKASPGDAEKLLAALRAGLLAMES